jgi:hypothetical protein
MVNFPGDIIAGGSFYFDRLRRRNDNYNYLHFFYVYGDYNHANDLYNPRPGS